MARLRVLVQTAGWTQAQAAERCGIAQSRVSDLLRGTWDKFSLDMRITLTARAGRKVELAVIERLLQSFRHTPQQESSLIGVSTGWSLAILGITNSAAMAFVSFALMSVVYRVYYATAG